MSLYDRLVALKEDFWGAAGDADFYRRHLAAEACMVFGPTGVLDRDATIKAVAQSSPWDIDRLEDVRLLPPPNRVAGQAGRRRLTRAESRHIVTVNAVSCTDGPAATAAGKGGGPVQAPAHQGAGCHSPC